MISGSISWTSANAAAQASTWDGESGYLATITSAAEQAFLNVLNHDFVESSPVHFGQYVSAWLGGTDAASEGTWGWANGDSWTYSNWNTYEPNDGIFSFLTEDYLVSWWSGDKWNDCGDDCLIQKYVVEYDAAPGEVPVPASLPLVLAGLGALGLVARRRKAA